jgi:carboxyl-terminal processing protease
VIRKIFSARFAVFIVIATFVISAAYLMGILSRSTPSQSTTEIPEFEVFWEAWRLVDDNFYAELPASKTVTYAAIRGALTSLEDPYTILVEPQPRQLEKDDLHGSFGGIGVWLSQIPDGAFVLSPMRDRPAIRAGIQEGDVLVSVNDTMVTSEMGLSDVQVLLRGPVGSEVRVTVRREGTPDPVVVSIIREEIVTPSVTWRMIEDQPDMGYVKIVRFTERTPQELEEAIADLRDQGMMRLILDLRDNGGGLLTETVQVASQFLHEGVVLYERKRYYDEEKSYPVQADGVARDAPLAVLINGGTASAAEIVAGALQDHERGALIGERTFGKGSVQLIYDLSDGSSLHVTSAQWFTPKRHQISGQGLMPNIEVQRTEEDRAEGRDPQLERAIAYLMGS